MDFLKKLFRKSSPEQKSNKPFQSKESIAMKLLATMGNTKAKSLVGKMYYEGKDVPQNYTEATLWLNAAAEEGDADAQGLLASMYDDGVGIGQDHAKALEFYTKAAQQGRDAAAYFVGRIYLEGRGVAKSEAKAAEWYRISAKAGNVGAQGVLMVLLMHGGENLEQDLEQAYFWALIGARAKHPVVLSTVAELAKTISAERKKIIQDQASAWKPGMHESVGREASLKSERTMGFEELGEVKSQAQVEKGIFEYHIALDSLVDYVDEQGDQIFQTNNATGWNNYGACVFVYGCVMIQRFRVKSKIHQIYWNTFKRNLTLRMVGTSEHTLEGMASSDLDEIGNLLESTGGVGGDPVTTAVLYFQKKHGIQSTSSGAKLRKLIDLTIDKAAEKVWPGITRMSEL